MAGSLNTGRNHIITTMSDKEKDNATEHNEDALNDNTTATSEQAGTASAETADSNVESNEGETDPLTTLQSKYDELNDKYLRLYSDFDNFRRRTAKERIELLKTGGEDVLKAMLPVIDDFERALKNMDAAKDVSSVREGVDLIYSKMTKELGNKGLKTMDCIGQPFDPDFHEALTQIPAPSDDMKNKVVDEMEKGYFLHDKVIRFAKVVVGS
jgi:molecular chaperone GrpE